jgi:hypothetical protein
MENGTQIKYGYIEWLSPEEMHQATLSWISELNFTRDEQRFLDTLVKSHTLQLTEAEIFGKSRELVGEIVKAEKEVVTLMKKVQSHENLLEIMVDDIDQVKMEKAYRDTHRELTILVNDYLSDYMKLKKRLFALLGKVLKKEKQKRLLN